MKKTFSFFISVLILIAACTCSQTVSAQAIPSLKQTFQKDFLIGTAVNTAQIEEKDAVADELIKTQFNAVTPENIMKAEIIHPAWDTYAIKDCKNRS